MCSFWTTNGIVLGVCARTNTLVLEHQLRNVEIKVFALAECVHGWIQGRRWVGYATWQYDQYRYVHMHLTNLAFSHFMIILQLIYSIFSHWLFCTVLLDTEPIMLINIPWKRTASVTMSGSSSGYSSIGELVNIPHDEYILVRQQIWGEVVVFVPAFLAVTFWIKWWKNYDNGWHLPNLP